MQNTKYIISSEIISRNNPDGTVILMKMDDSNFFYKINGIAAEIWNSLCKGIDLKETANRILKEYNVLEETLNNDIENFLNTLIEKKLIAKAE